MRPLLALLALLLAWPAQAQQRQPANVSTLPQSSPQEFDLLDNTGAWLPFFPGAKDVFVRNYGPHNDWIGDDGPAIAAALNAASAAGGGTVYLDQVSYWNQTQALIVPKGVHLRCVGAFVKRDLLNENYTARPCTIYQKSGTSLRVDGAITDMGVLQDQAHFANITSSTTRAQWTTFVNGFVGVGVAIGDLVTEAGSQAVVQNVQIGGFNLCLQVKGADQVQLRQILGDCTNGLDINNSYDNNFLSDIEFWEFLSTHKPIASVGWPITAIADNGSGSWRVTFTAAAGGQPPPATGEQIWVYPGSGTTDGVTGPGAPGSAGLWTVTAVDSTHVDLQTSVTAPSTTGTTAVSSTYVPVTSTADLQAGMGVTGAGIPAGAVIAAVWRSRSAISLDQAHEATAAASGVPLAFTNPPFTSDAAAQLYWSGNRRMGTAFAIGRADGTTCSACFAFGYLVAFNFRNAFFVNFTNSNDDGPEHDRANKNAVPIGVEFTGGSYSTYFQTASNSTEGVHVLHNSTANQGNIVQVSDPSSFSNNSTIIENGSGTLAAIGTSTNLGGNILLDFGGVITTTTLNGLAMPNVRLYGTGARPIFYGSGNTFQSGITGNTDPMWDQRSPAFVLSGRYMSASPLGGVVDFYNGGEAVNEKIWRWFGSSKSVGMCLQAADDAYATSTNALCAHRSGTSISDVTISAPIVATSTSTGAGGIAPFSFTDSSLSGNQSVLAVIGGDSSNSGGQIKLVNTNAAAVTPNKYLRVKTTGEFQLVNSAYSQAITSIDDTGNFATTGSVITAGYTIGGTLPACTAANKGANVWVSNGQTSPPYLGAVSTTGAVVAPLFCNGSGWVYH